MKESGSVAKMFWVTRDILEILDNACRSEGFVNRSDALRNRVRSGDILVKTMKGVKNNPESLQKAMIELNTLRQQEKLGNYLESLPIDVRNGIVDMIHLINVGKWSQTNLISYGSNDGEILIEENR